MSQAVERVVRAIVIGHVDSGKSTLSGQLAILTDKVDRRAIEKIESEVRLMKKHGGAPPAWVMDDGAERESGNTVECGQIRIDTGNKLVHIIDAPGHERYVRHMVKEVPNADVAVLVVPAPGDDLRAGIAGGRIKEHAMLARAAGVKYFVVVVNKMDAVGYSQDAYEAARSEVAKLMKKLGYVEGSTAWFVPASALGGENLKVPFAPGVCRWWTGGTLLKVIDDLPEIKRSQGGPLRFRVTDRGDAPETAVGTIISGTLTKGPAVVMPGRRRVVVSKLEVDGAERESVAAGEIASARLAGVGHVAPGDVVCAAGDLCEVSDAFYAMVMVTCKLLTVNSAGVAHIGCAAVDATVSKMHCYVDPKTREADKTRPPPKILRELEVAVVEVRLAAPVCLARNVDCPDLGKLVIRDGDTTLLTGVVTRTTPQDA